MSVNRLAKHHLEFLILKGSWTGSCESTLVKMPHCWKSHSDESVKVLSLRVYKYCNQHLILVTFRHGSQKERGHRQPPLGPKDLK